jgi:diacylglycerol kinase
MLQKNLFLTNLFKMTSLLKSFGFAIQGIIHLLKNERNFKIQFGVFILVLVFSYFLEISKIELIIVLFCSMTVLSLEGINTSIERLCDENQPQFNLNIKIIKDVAAGAVLIASIFSAIIGLIVFLPYFYRVFTSL